MHAIHPASTYAPRLAVGHSVARSASYIPRKDRPHAWGRSAWQRRLANPPAGEAARDTAMRAAETFIETTFGVAAIHNRLKADVERFMLLGAWARQTRCHFHQLGYDADGRSLATTLQMLELRIAGDRRHARRLRMGDLGGFAKPVDPRLLEARLFCRWFRRHGAPELWSEIIDALTTPPDIAPPQVHFADDMADAS